MTETSKRPRSMSGVRPGRGPRLGDARPWRARGCGRRAGLTLICPTSAGGDREEVVDVEAGRRRSRARAAAPRGRAPARPPRCPPGSRRRAAPGGPAGSTSRPRDRPAPRAATGAALPTRNPTDQQRSIGSLRQLEEQLGRAREQVETGRPVGRRRPGRPRAPGRPSSSRGAKRSASMRPRMCSTSTRQVRRAGEAGPDGPVARRSRGRPRDRRPRGGCGGARPRSAPARRGRPPGWRWRTRRSGPGRWGAGTRAGAARCRTRRAAARGSRRRVDRRLRPCREALRRRVRLDGGHVEGHGRHGSMRPVALPRKRLASNSSKERV